DIHCLDLRFATTRLPSPRVVNARVHSIEQSGQLSPVAVIGGEKKRFILMDGYLRLAALRRMGSDTVYVTLWDCDEAGGLLRVLAGAQAHPWAAIEEARTIRMLMNQFACSQHAIAKSIGRDVSWVNRRLSLIASVSDEVLTTICKGRLSTWAASRIIAPLARANTGHAGEMVKFLERHRLSTRELSLWNNHYQKASRPVRNAMVKDPALFLDALANKEQEQQANILAAGPEGAWLKDMSMIKAILKRQRSAIAMLFSSAHNEQDQQPLRQAFAAIESLLDSMRKEMSS
ncbi:MAG: ParB N-terminal domain-containing protein, partial [Mariprofundaceae bacterium]|nr:ParB N-terminal domain-containing protein [Mariprofundaceae bacterium]